MEQEDTSVEMTRLLSRNRSKEAEEEEEEEEKSEARAAKPPSFYTALPQWWSIFKIWPAENERWMARIFFGIKVLLSLLYTLLLVRVSYELKHIETSISEKKHTDFILAIMRFVGIIVVAAPLFAVDAFVEDRLALAWRAFLTKRLLGSYFGGRSFFLLNGYSQIDNPDQRICEDINSYVDTSVLLTMLLIKKVFNLIAFAGVLWSIAPSLVFFLFAYAIFGTAITTIMFGKALMHINFTVLQREADFRFGMVRVREHAESIAFYAGEKNEEEISLVNFESIVKILLRRIKWMAGLNLWTNLYSYSTIIIPKGVTAIMFFKGMIEFGVISQATYAFNQIEDALSSLILKFQEVGQLAAQSQRLSVLMKLMDDLHEPQGKEATKTSRIEWTELVPPPYILQFESLRFTTPGGKQVICAGQDLSMAEGESLLVIGPSGCGKSSLLRAIAGLWTKGEGTIRTPPSNSLFFLPQRPYMPLGSLRYQLLFPSNTLETVSDRELRELLNRVGLSDLPKKIGGFSKEKDWLQVLSVGEQQRVAFLRLLIHQPQLAFLDEASSAMDALSEQMCYEAMKSVCSSFVSVGHRLQLVEHHTHVLEFQGDGVWLKYPSQEFQSKSKFRGSLG